MNESKTNNFLKLRFFFAVAIIVLYLLHGLLFEFCGDCEVNLFNYVLLFSAIFILINKRWVYRTLLCLNVLAFASNLFDGIIAIHYIFGIGAVINWLRFLAESNKFYWDVAFWFLQISLIIYLIAIEIKVYKTKNSLV